VYLYSVTLSNRIGPKKQGVWAASRARCVSREKTVHDHQQRDIDNYGRKIDCTNISKRAGTLIVAGLFCGKPPTRQSGEESGVPAYPGADEVEDTSTYLDALKCIEAATVRMPVSPTMVAEFYAKLERAPPGARPKRIRR
jgi:hypothetical protein